LELLCTSLKVKEIGRLFLWFKARSMDPHPSNREEEMGSLLVNHLRSAAVARKRSEALVIVSLRFSGTIRRLRARPEDGQGAIYEI
jgi:hypothetical protein